MRASNSRKENPADPKRYQLVFVDQGRIADNPTLLGMAFTNQIADYHQAGCNPDSRSATGPPMPATGPLQKGANYKLERSAESALVRITDSSRTSRHVSKVPQPNSCTATNHYSIRSDRKLFRSDNPDATQLALLNEVNKSNVGPVKCIVPHWGASLSGFFTQQLIHCQSFPQNRSPFFRQIFCLKSL